MYRNACSSDPIASIWNTWFTCVVISNYTANIFQKFSYELIPCESQLHKFDLVKIMDNIIKGEIAYIKRNNPDEFAKCTGADCIFSKVRMSLHYDFINKYHYDRKFCEI